jgi:hypothetical protein
MIPVIPSIQRLRIFRLRAIAGNFIRETQISKTQCIEICKSNNPTEGGGFHTRDYSFINLVTITFTGLISLTI